MIPLASSQLITLMCDQSAQSNADLNLKHHKTRHVHGPVYSLLGRKEDSMCARR